MKKLFVIVLAAIGMVSCMNTDEVIEVNNDNAIAFADAFIENSVRAEITTADLDQFNVWGWMQEDAVTATVFEAVNVTNSGAGWTYSPAQYWVPGFTYTFQALSSNLAEADRNWTATAANGAVSVVEFTNENGTEDLIYATATVDAPALGQTKTVALKFDHQLAKVKFTFEYNAALNNNLGDGLKVVAENIKMVVPAKGKINYSATTPAWELIGTNTKELVFAAAGDELLTIPAEDYTYDITFDVNLYQGNTKVKTLVTKTASVVLDVVKGCAYNFTAELTPENLQMDSIDFTPEVNPWNPNGNAGFTPDATMTQVAEGVFTDPAGVYYIYNVAGLTWLSNAVNGTLPDSRAAAAQSFDKKTIKLMNDIDLAGIEWTPIGRGSNHFRGTFDGNGKTIENMTITKRNDDRAALFGTVSYTVAFKNLTIKNANVDCPDFNGDFYGSALIGTAYGNVTIENVDIVDSNISGNNKVGALIAHDGVMNTLTVSGCDVLNTTFEALNAEDGGSVGGLLGYFQTGGEHTISNSSVKNCTFNVVNSTNTGKRANGQLIGGIDSKAGQILNINDCVVENNTWNEKFYVDGTEVTDGTFVSPYGELIGGERDDVANGKVYVDGYELIAGGVGIDEDGVYYILNAAGWNWMEAQTDAFFKGKTIALGKDIDFNGAAINPTRFWDPENRTKFDGQNFTVKNFEINGGNNSSIALFNGTLDVKNLKIDSATVSGYGYVAVVGGTIYGNIDNVHITNSTVFGNYWNVGGFAGQFNSGNITNCSIKNTTITGPSAVGALAGITNETRNERKFENCVVEGCTIVQNYSFGSDHDICYGVATGLINFDNGSVYFTNVTMTNNTIKGAASSVLYGECEASTTVYVDGLLPVASGLGLNAEGAYVVTTGEGFKTVATTILNDRTKNVTVELANDIDLAGIEWPAVCTNAAFELDGKGFAIKNLTTSAVESHGFYSTAMFTSTRQATTIKNLVVENATVTGKGGDNSHGAVLVACNYSDLNIEGVTVKNSTINNCDRTGGLVTYLYTDGVAVKNCIVEGCTINSIGTAGAILGMNDGHNFEMKGCQVVNTTVSSSEGNNKAGILIGTWQDAGTLTKENNTIENSKAINAGVETNNEIGRHA